MSHHAGGVAAQGGRRPPAKAAAAKGAAAKAAAAKATAAKGTTAAKAPRPSLKAASAVGAAQVAQPPPQRLFFCNVTITCPNAKQRCCGNTCMPNQKDFKCLFDVVLCPAEQVCTSGTELQKCCPPGEHAPGGGCMYSMGIMGEQARFMEAEADYLCSATGAQVHQAGAACNPCPLPPCWPLHAGTQCIDGECGVMCGEANCATFCPAEVSYCAGGGQCVPNTYLCAFDIPDPQGPGGKVPPFMCGPGFVCTDQGCAPDTNLCGSGDNMLVCGIGAKCLDKVKGRCSSVDRCEGGDCAQGQVCLAGKRCCPKKKVCGKDPYRACCKDSEQCMLGQCLPRQELCGRGPAAMYCTPGYICQKGRCTLQQKMCGQGNSAACCKEVTSHQGQAACARECWGQQVKGGPACAGAGE